MPDGLIAATIDRAEISLGLENSLEVEMHGLNVELLRHHNPPYDGVSEEREEHVAEEDEHPHQHADNELLRGVHRQLVVPCQT